MPNVYIDASGTGGVLRSRTDRRLYVVCAVFLGSSDAVDQLAALYESVRVNLPETQKEFKSNKNKRANMKLLDGMLQSPDWCYAATLAWKEDLHGTPYERSAQCQRWFIKRALVLNRPALSDGEVVLDKGATDLHDRNLLHILKSDRQLGKYPAVVRAHAEESHEEWGLQLADVVAGAVADVQYALATGTADEYKSSLAAYELVRPRQTVLWQFPFDVGDKDRESLADQPLAVQDKLDFWGG